MANDNQRRRSLRALAILGYVKAVGARVDDAGEITTPDPPAPLALVSAAVSADNPKRILLTFNQTLDPESVPFTGDFAVSGSKVVGTLYIEGNTLALFVDAAYINGEAITFSHTPGTYPITDVNASSLGAISNQAVTNGIPVLTAQAVAFYSLTNLVAEADEVYAANSSGTSTTAQGLIREAAMPGYECWLELENPVSSDQSSVVAVDTVAAAQTFGLNDFIANCSAASLIQRGQNTASLTSTGFTLPQGSGCRYRLHRSAANVWSLQTTEDNGANWTVRHTFVGGDGAASRRVHFYTTFSTFARKMYRPRWAGLQIDVLGARLMADGNSQTAGVNGASNSWPGQLATELAVTVNNHGVGSQDTTDMIADAATQIDAALITRMNVLIAGEVRNELVAMGANADARDAVDLFWSYCDARKAAAAVASKPLKIVAWNVLPAGHTASPIGIAALNELFDEANLLMAQEWPDHVDAFVNVRSAPQLLDPFNLTYFTDDVHLTTAGDTILKNLIRNALLTLW